MEEELGVQPARLDFAYQYLWRGTNETELVRTFAILHEGPFRLQADELDGGRFWSFDEIAAAAGHGILTPQFEHEFPRLRDWWRIKQSSMTHFTR